MRLTGTHAAYLLLVLVAGALAGTALWWLLHGSVEPPQPPPPPPLAWAQATSSAPWRARDSAETFIFNGKLWIMGGINADEQTNSAHVARYWEAPHFNDVWYTADGYSWEQSTTTPAWPPRRSMSVVPFNGELWMFGGWSPIGGYQSDVWRSADGHTWRRAYTAPWSPREGQMTELFNGALYMLGGVNYDTRQEFSDVWYTRDGLVWEEAPQAPWSPRWDHATAVFNDTLYVAGGMDLEGREFGDVWTTQDGALWTQSTTTPVWQTRQGHQLAVLDGKLWLLGRLNDAEHGGTNDMWYTQDGQHWEQWGELPWLGREDFNAEVFNDALWIMAGMGADWHWRNDVWQFGRSAVPSVGIEPTSTP